MSKQNNDNCVCGDDNEDNDSSTEGENDKMLVFVQSIHDDSPETNRCISEVKKNILDTTAARSEHERFSDNYVEFKVP